MNKIQNELIPFLLTISICFSGCMSMEDKIHDSALQETDAKHESVSTVETYAPIRRIMIQTGGNLGQGCEFSAEELNGQYDGSLVYSMDAVTILIANDNIPLEEAIRLGKVTVEGLTADAITDERNGFCKKTSSTYHGLTTWTFTYPEYKFAITDDIFQAPNGNEYPIKSFYILGPDERMSGTPLLLEGEGADPAYPLDREDWGLDIQVSKVDDSGILLSIAQSGGQQIGQLIAEEYWLYNTDTDEWLNLGTRINPSVLIPEGGVEDLYIVFDTPIEPGNYVMYVVVLDDYDHELCHPLIQKFHDEQRYFLSFSLGER